MLRSLDPKFECVTLPFWDHLAASALSANNQCSNVENCARIVTDFGGSTQGRTITLRVYNVSIVPRSPGRCISASVLGSFCGNNTGCAGCIVRGAPYNFKYPAEAALPSVYRQLFSNNTWEGFARNVETGVHNVMHSAMGGTMNYLQSPIDPIFYTHHSFIDLMQSVYLKCQLGDETALIPVEERANDIRLWANCSRRSGGQFRPQDPITMRTRAFNETWVHVRTTPQNMLYPFFKDLPGRFIDYVDAKDLGPYSYTYAFTGALTNLNPPGMQT
ncbi:hypothetical protein ATCC90586_011468 [Pythium insidiosum]|nr:hypothetical protein ATCC90586_011468 [Pythium insidiosum]